MQAGRYPEAEGAYREALELAPRRVGTHAFLALALSWERRHDEAIGEAMREPEDIWRLWALAIVYQVADQTKESETALRELGDKEAEDGAYQIAEAHAMRGEVDAAFAWLERADAQRDGGLCDVPTSPYLQSLHSDPRWDTFLRKMGFHTGAEWYSLVWLFAVVGWIALRRPPRLALYCLMQIPIGLKPHPQLRRRFQQPREPKRSIGSDTSLPEDNFIQPVERNAQSLGGLELPETERLQILLQ
jgi:hypothetical protein